ncbi:HD domain-containing protein [Candidatus Woesearchaeota archaeon]|nr:HD domain-containing protein [Candidatus Woesearchaeota archaeon]
MEEIWEEIIKIVEKECTCPAHNKDHVMRVFNLCMNIAEDEDVDMDVLKAAALLHDIGGRFEMEDPTGEIDHALLGAEIAEKILKDLGFPEEKIGHVKDCIISHRYRTGNKPKTKEAEILFDADKLDAAGAIGVARAFVWIGRHNGKIYRDVKVEDYVIENLGGKMNGRIQDNTKHCPQMGYETKLKFLADKLYTKKGREIGRDRIAFFKSVLDRMEQEINGKL